VAGDDAVGAFLAGEDDHGHASAGVGGGSGEVEVFVLSGGFGGFKAVVALPVGDDAVDRAAVGAIHLFEVDRSEEVFDDDAFAKAFDAAAFHFVEAAFLEGEVVIVGDAGVFAEGWDMGEDFDVVATGGGFGGIGAGGGDDVEGGVIREVLVFEDGAEVFVLIFGEEEVVVGKLGEVLVGAEVEDDAGAGGGEFFLELFGKGFGLFEKFLVSGDDFHVADDDISGVGGAVGQVDGGD